MEFTKKQLAVLNRIYKRQIKYYKLTKKSDKTGGIVASAYSNGDTHYVITDGFMAVSYPTCPAGIPMDQEPHPNLHKMIWDEFIAGDLRMVVQPVDVKAWRKTLTEWRKANKGNPDGCIKTFSAHHTAGNFRLDLVCDLMEAVGKGALLYISQREDSKYPKLVAVPENWMDLNDLGWRTMPIGLCLPNRNEATV